MGERGWLLVVGLVMREAVELQEVGVSGWAKGNDERRKKQSEKILTVLRFEPVTPVW